MSEPNHEQWEMARKIESDLREYGIWPRRVFAQALSDLESATRAKVLREVLDWVKGYDVRCFEVDGDDVGFVQQADLFVFLDRIAKGAE